MQALLGEGTVKNSDSDESPPAINCESTRAALRPKGAVGKSASDLRGLEPDQRFVEQCRDSLLLFAMGCVVGS